MLGSLFITNLFSGMGGAVIILLATAVAHRFDKVRGDRRARSTGLAERVEKLETGVTALNVGLFGEDTKFGHKDGFVDQVKRALDQHGADIKLLVADTKTNGGKSSKDDLQAIREAVTGEHATP